MGERRKTTPKDPEDVKGGVRGTHGLGDLPRDRQKVHPVASQGGTASRTGESAKARSARGGGTEPPDVEEDEGIDEERAYEHNLATRTAPGPGPKDRDAGSARAKDLDERKLRRKG